MSIAYEPIAVSGPASVIDSERLRHLSAGTVMAEADLPRLWLLRQGVVAVYQPTPTSAGDRPQYLALPGDLIGAEQLAGEATPSRISILANAVIAAVPCVTSAQRHELLTSALVQARRQAREFLCLRSGSLADRVRHLLLMLGATHGEEVNLQLPPLRQLSGLFDATPEAICRVLGGLKQLDVLVAQHDRQTRVVRRALKELVVPPGLSSGRNVRRAVVRVA